MGTVGLNLFYAPMPDITTRDLDAIIRTYFKTFSILLYLNRFQTFPESFRGPLMNFCGANDYILEQQV